MSEVTKKAAVIGSGSFGKAMKAMLKIIGVEVVPADGDMKGVSACFLCIPARGLGDVDWKALRDVPVVLMSKGMTPEGKLPSEVAREKLGEEGWCWMGGPMFADDVKDHSGWGASVAGPAAEKAMEVLPEGFAFVTERPVDELCLDGVMKNVYALAFGYIEGKFGRSAVGMAGVQATKEMAWRLPCEVTFSADLLGSMCVKSRNYKTGFMLAIGGKVEYEPEGLLSVHNVTERFNWKELPMMKMALRALDDYKKADDGSGKEK